MVNNIQNFKGYNGNPNLKKSGVGVEWTEELVTEWIKCSEDPVYFCETYMKIIHVDRGLIAFSLYDYQKEMLESMHHNRNTIITTSRQSGKSTTSAAFILWYIIFHSEKTVALLANKGDISQEILGRIQLAYQHLPKWLQQGVVEWNKKSFVLENQSRVIASATSADSIRGYSVSLLFIDECVLGSTQITVRSKKTGNISLVQIKSLMNIIDLDDLEVLTENGFKSFSGIKRSIKDCYFLIHFNDGSILECSYEHRVKMKTENFSRAFELVVGDEMFGELQVTAIQLIEKEVEVYDLLNVEGTYAYITNNVVSHNCAFVENWTDFFTSTVPTITSGTTTKIILVSTPNGLNHFHKMWSFALQGKNEYNPIEVKWNRVPGRDEAWKKRTIETDLNYDYEKFEQEHNCVGGNTTITVKNIQTGVIQEIAIEDLYKELENE